MAENCGDLSRLDRTTVIFVKESEGSAHVLLIEQLVLIDGGCAPLAEINGTAMVHISVKENFDSTTLNDFFILIWEKALVAIDELLFLDKTITVLVPLVERFLELGLLGLGGQMTSHESHRRLLHLGLVLQ